MNHMVENSKGAQTSIDFGEIENGEKRFPEILATAGDPLQFISVAVKYQVISLPLD